MLLNQNICAKDYSYNCNADAQLLLGIRHALLRREFRKVEKKERIFPDTGKNLLVTLGGGDAGNLSLGIIEALNQPEFRVPAALLAEQTEGATVYWRIEAVLPDGTRVSSAVYVVRLQ